MAMATDYRVFDLNVTCAEGIEGVLSFIDFFHKWKVYAVVSVVGASPDGHRETPVAKYFGRNPVWNFPMRFYLEESELRENALTALRIQLKRKRSFGEDEDIAEALVPLKNLFHGNENVTNCTSSLLLSPSGGRRGFVYFSYYFSRIHRATAGFLVDRTYQLLLNYGHF